ncbi:hypothetical protein NQ318_019912 [Aromia moschata]|uniref:DNA mismatch repair protein MutS clamp domain-containing protein n=1 Tax=Aromia moschata TaxID=1265417 RepID=A0AAV8XIM4_9CUCU|nr:hypothetical protein NQ318_019912 [Aromia moschata]
MILEKMKKLLRRTADDLEVDEKAVKLETTDQHGYFFRVTQKEEQALRRSKNYKIIDALKGGVRFTNTKLMDLNRDYDNVKTEYVERQKTVVAEIFEVAEDYNIVSASNVPRLRAVGYYAAKIHTYVYVTKKTSEMKKTGAVSYCAGHRHASSANWRLSKFDPLLLV